MGWLPVRGVKEPFLNAAGRPAPIYRVEYGGGQRDELETYELLDESTLLLPRNSEEWQGETAFTEFLRERDVACKFSSYKYVGAETVRSFFDFGGTAEALMKEICQERCTIANVDGLWSEYCAQTLDEGAEREKPEAKKRAQPAAPLRVGSSVQTVAGAQDRWGRSVAAARGIVTELGDWVGHRAYDGGRRNESARGLAEACAPLVQREVALRPQYRRGVWAVVRAARRRRGHAGEEGARTAEGWGFGGGAAGAQAVGQARAKAGSSPRSSRWPVRSRPAQRRVAGRRDEARIQGHTEVTTTTGYVVTVFRTDLTKLLLGGGGGGACDRFRLRRTSGSFKRRSTAQFCASVYEGRTFGNCFATKDGPNAATFTVESNGDVRCALCDWTAP